MIRGLENNDRDAVLDLLRAVGNFSPAEIAFAEEVIDIALGKPGQNDYHGFVEVPEPMNGSRACGFLLVGPTPATTGTWDMYWIAVHPSHQGAGVAQALETFAESFVRERGGYWLIAETSSQPAYARARAFYQKQRYVELARIADYYQPADDLVIFGRRL